MDLEHGAPRNLCCLHAVTDEDGDPLENEDASSRMLCHYWGTIFQAHTEGPRHQQDEKIMWYVQKAPDDIRWVIDKNEFDELMASKKESAFGFDEIPYSFYRCAGGLGSRILFSAYKNVLEGGIIPAHVAENRTVFIPKFSDIDDNGRIIRSPEALRPLTLCDCDCKLLTTAICRCFHWYTMRCIHPRRDVSN